MNTTFAYWDRYSRSFYDPRRNGAPVFGWAMPRLDWIRFRLAITNGKARIDSATGIPLAAYRYNASEYTSSLFALKSAANFVLDASGALDFSNGGGFETGDTSWHSASIGCVTLAPIILPLTLASGLYNSEVILLKTNVRWTLRPDTGPYAPPVDVQRDVFCGNESNAPSGLPGGLTGAWTISGTSLYVDVSVPGATASCLLAIGVSPSTGGAGDPGTVIQTPLAGGVDTVRLSVASSPGMGGTFTGRWTLLNL
jgi:hypothetical protein